MSPESALEHVPGMSGASVGITFADGVTAHTSLVEQGDEKYVLRVDKPTARELGLDRRKEEEICRVVAAAGLSPDPVFFDHERGIHLRRFVGGTNWVVSDLHDRRELKRLAAVLVELHDLPPVQARFDPGGAVQRYADHLGTAEARELGNQALELLRRIGKGWQQCLCHNDLLNHNILESDELMLIDWEFAGMGDPYFDLAVIAQHHELPDRLARTLLKFYLGRRPDKAEIERLTLQRQFYALLLKLWCLRTETSKTIHTSAPEDRAELPG